MARLCPLFSGSSGNSYYIGSRQAGLLLDVGRSARQIENMLRLCGIDPLAVKAILITHEHTDHIAGVQVFARRYGLPVYGSPGTLRAMGSTLTEIEQHPIEDTQTVAGLMVTPFATSHDSAQSLGFLVETEDQRSFALATDTGVLTEAILSHLEGADFAVVESNHDRQMLRDGPYPAYLKARILSSRGHLANEDCASALVRLAQTGCRRFLLAHLSRENNTPQRALQTSLAALEAAGLRRDVDFTLDVAPPENTSGRSILF